MLHCRLKNEAFQMSRPVGRGVRRVTEDMQKIASEAGQERSSRVDAEFRLGGGKPSFCRDGTDGYILNNHAD